MKIFYDQAYKLEKNKNFKTIFELNRTFSSNVYSETYKEDQKNHIITYGEYIDKCLNYGRKLSTTLIDIPRGSFIGLKLPNCPEWGMIFWGLLMSGYCPFVIDRSLNDSETAILLKETKAPAVIVEQGKSTLPEYIGIDAVNRTGNSVCTGEWADKVAFCSSGTVSRTVCIFDGVAMSDQILAAYSMPEQTDDIMYDNKRGCLKNLALLPFSHIFGFVAVFLWYTFFGRTLVFIEKLEADIILNACRSCRVSHLFAVPLLWDKIAKEIEKRSSGNASGSKTLRRIVDYANSKTNNEHVISSPHLSKFVLKRIRKRLFGNSIVFLISGGSNISTKTLSIINALGYNLYNGYGLTEAGITSVCFDKDVEGRISGNVGFPLYGVDYSIDSNTGELMIDSHYLAKQYIQDGDYHILPKPYRTGDLARKDTDGKYFILGKIKDIIINSSGENIIPYELEALLDPLDGVDAFIVTGIDTEEQKDMVTLVVYSKKSLSRDEVISIGEKVGKVNSHLPIYKRIVEVLLTKSAFPMTNTGKIKRIRIREMVNNMPAMFVSIKKYLQDDDNRTANCDRMVLDKVRYLTSEALSVRPEEIGDNDHIIFDLGGDSISYVSLVTMLEKEFRVKLPLTSITRCNTVLDFAEHIESMKKMEEYDN